MIRKLLEILAVVAVLNLMALGGLAAYAVTSGAITVDKARYIVAIMNGEQPLPGDESDEDEDEVADDKVISIASVNPVAQTEMGKEMLRREADRIKAELDQRLALNNSILLRVTSERERFRQEQANAAKKRKSRTKQRRDEGFKKQLAIMESLSPKVASENLLAMEDLDDAVQMLLQMQTGKAKKIIESVKRTADKEKMREILRRMRDVPYQQAVNP